MKDLVHTLQCNLLMIPPKVDRFFMDMRVYELIAPDMKAQLSGEDTLLWRGIYLAVEMEPAKTLEDETLNGLI